MANAQDSTARLQQLKEQRPQRAPDCIVERQQRDAGAPAWILKDAAGCRYMRLSAEGFFLWQLIDGTRTVGDLCVAYVAHVGRPAPHEALRALARLHQAGFVVFASPDDDRTRPAPRATLRRLASLCTWYAWLPDMDRRITALYGALRLLYTPLAQAILLVLTGAGALAAAWHWTGSALRGLPHASILWIAGLALHVLVHEAAHALTCKHFGRAVHRVGVGWYFFAPVAFVDTSDMWAAARWSRIAVSAAGPYANLVLAGIAALAALAPGSAGVHAALGSFSLVGYGLAAVNMNPLLELDGYYVLMDFCEIPNLRSRALACLGARLRGQTGAASQGRRALLLFGAASLAYGLLMGFGVLVASRAWIGNLANAWLPHAWAQMLAWTLAATLGLLILYRLVEGLRTSPPRR